MSKKRALTDDYVKNLRRPPKGGRYEIADPGARRLWLRVGRKNIVFVVIARLGGSSNITRLHLGTYGEGEMDLDAARAEAKRLNDLIDRGLDPREEDERVAVERATGGAEPIPAAQRTLRTLPAGHGACLFSVDNGQTPLARRAAGPGDRAGIDDPAEAVCGRQEWRRRRNGARSAWKARRWRRRNAAPRGLSAPGCRHPTLSTGTPRARPDAVAP